MTAERCLNSPGEAWQSVTLFSTTSNKQPETAELRPTASDALPWVMDSPASEPTALTKISILMCVYNEERTIEQAVHELLTVQYPCEVELIVVDDGSTDATTIRLSEVHDPRIVMHRHPENMGKGAALRSAVSLATGSHILPFDADLEYSADDIPRLLEPVLRGKLDVVYGTRLFGCNTVYQSYRYAVGNRMLTRAANILFDSYLSDLHTCLKLMPLSLFKSLQLSEAGFGLDTEITAWLLRRGVRPFEVPISYYSRSHAQGKKITWRDAVACLRILIRVRLARHQPLAFVDRSIEDGYVLKSPKMARHALTKVAPFAVCEETDEANAATTG